MKVLKQVRVKGLWQASSLILKGSQKLSVDVSQDMQEFIVDILLQLDRD